MITNSCSSVGLSVVRGPPPPPRRPSPRGRPSPCCCAARIGPGTAVGISAIFLPVGTAVWIKIWSPQTIGVPVPRPRILTFHFTFSVALHFTGGSAFGPSPVPSGPRHLPQFSSVAAPTDKAESKIQTVETKAPLAESIRSQDDRGREAVTYSAAMRLVGFIYRFFPQISGLCGLLLVLSWLRILLSAFTCIYVHLPAFICSYLHLPALSCLKV